MTLGTKEVYQTVFKEYSDVMDVKQVSVLLGVSTKTIYKLIGNKSLLALKVGREFRIPKVNVMRYVKVFDTLEISAKEF
jgi:excisionase family DNA binding protein